MGTFDSMVQGPIYTESWGEDEVKLFNPNAHIIANIPYSNEVNAAGNNLEIFMGYSKGMGRTQGEFREAIYHITAALEELVKRSAENNLAQTQEAAENAGIILEGIADYIEQMDDAAPYAEILNEDAFITGLLEAEGYLEDTEESIILEAEVVEEVGAAGDGEEIKEEWEVVLE